MVSAINTVNILCIGQKHVEREALHRGCSSSNVMNPAYVINSSLLLAGLPTKLARRLQTARTFLDLDNFPKPRSNNEVLPTIEPPTTMADQNPSSSQSVYPLPPGDTGYDAGYRYEDAAQAAAAALPQSQAQPPQPAYEEHNLQGSRATPSASKSRNGGEVKPRLRKACDSCSVRKVKVPIHSVPIMLNTSPLTIGSAMRPDRLASRAPA